MPVTLCALGAESIDLALRFVKAYFDHDGLDFNEAVVDGVRQLLDNPAFGTFWTIKSEGSDIGYIVLTYGFDHEFGGRIGVITDFYLEETARSSGFGAVVLSLVEAEAHLMGLRGLELFVLKHNERASRFYRRVGFQEQTDRVSLWKPLA